MSRFGPTRGEVKLRLAVALAGLALMAYALWHHGVVGIAWLEVALFAGAFFGGTAVWAAWKLWRGRGRG